MLTLLRNKHNSKISTIKLLIIITQLFIAGAVLSGCKSNTNQQIQHTISKKESVNKEYNELFGKKAMKKVHHELNVLTTIKLGQPATAAQKAAL